MTGYKKYWIEQYGFTEEECKWLVDIEECRWLGEKLHPGTECPDVKSVDYLLKSIDG